MSSTELREEEDEEFYASQPAVGCTVIPSKVRIYRTVYLYGTILDKPRVTEEGGTLFLRDTSCVYFYGVMWEE